MSHEGDVEAALEHELQELQRRMEEIKSRLETIRSAKRRAGKSAEASASLSKKLVYFAHQGSQLNPL